MFDKLVAGEWQAGKVAYELTEEGTIVSDWHGWDEKLPEEKVTAINEFLEKLFAANTKASMIRVTGKTQYRAAAPPGCRAENRTMFPTLRSES